MTKISLLAALFIVLPGLAAASHEPHHKDIENTLRILFPSQKVTSSSHDLWDIIRNGFEMPHLDMAEVAIQERYYSKHPEYINRIVSRGSRYLYHIVSEVQRRSMPMEIALLPIVESAYNPRAESIARASGIWQFIPSTGKMYGLERTWWYDGRRDIVAATNAALDYLERLYDIFGDWPLALAAYNWGDGSVKRAQAKNSARGHATDYTAIQMPAETRNYVPKLLAIRNIIANPIAFGVKLAMIPNQPYFTTVKPERHMDVRIAATLAEISVEELLHLNPGYIRPVIAHKENRKLVLPIEKAEVFKKNLAQYTKPLLNWQPYTTKRGESFKEIAQRHNIPLETLQAVNSLKYNESKARGQTLLVPRFSQLDQTEQKTVMTIAAHREVVPILKHTPEITLEAPITHPLAVEKVSSNQNSTSTQTASSQPFKDLAYSNHTARTAKTKEMKTLRYQVKKGDTLYRLSKNFSLSIESLIETNHLKGQELRSGQMLIIPQSSTQ